MKWAKLLCETRTRELFGGDASTPDAGDPRTPFERDYDRVVFSTALRRLQDKAQVFPLERNDSVRTRLTHSLEVSTVAKGLAASVCRHLIERQEISPEQAKSIIVIAATCGLVHDLGNPPFGHAGEDAMREWFAKTLRDDVLLPDDISADFLSFDGNAQTIRLISRLLMLSDKYGLNLTCGTISASCKYVAAGTDIDEDIHERSKLGFFTSERDLVAQIRNQTGTELARNP